MSTVSAVLPSGAELEALATWNQMMAWAKLKLEQWQAFADELGNPELDYIPTIVAIAVDNFCDAAKTLNLKAVPKARINLHV